MAGLRWAGICCAGRGYTANMAQVTETPSSGYRYRAHIRRNAGGKAIAEAVTDIDYIKLQEQD
jgi:hypothetical protein